MLELPVFREGFINNNSSYNWFERWILRITRRHWNKYISAVLNAAQSERVIDSNQLHTLSAQFLPDQKGFCFKLDKYDYKYKLSGLHTTLRKSKGYWGKP